MCLCILVLEITFATAAKMSNVHLHSNLNEIQLPKNSSKYWFAYVKAVVYSTMKSIQTKFDHLKYAYITYLRLFSEITFIYDMKLSTNYSIITHNANETNTEEYTYAIYGNYSLYNSYYFDLNDEECQNDTGLYFIHKWQFQLDKDLRVNITFLYLRIYLFDINSCDLGHVLIQSSNRKYNNLQEIQYCGRYSSVKYYSASESVKVTISTKNLVSLEVNSLFSIIDKRLVLSWGKRKTTSYKILFIWEIYFEFSQSHLVKYLLQVDKLQYIVLTYSSSIVCSFLKSYDGPGTSSKILFPQLKDKKWIVISSSFQMCLFQEKFAGCFTHFGITFSSFSHNISQIQLVNLMKAHFSYTFHNSYNRKNVICFKLFKTTN